MAQAKETGPVARLAVWLLKKRVPEDDGFPEPLGDEAVIITFMETPCLVLYGYFASVLSLFALWMAYRSLHQWLLRRRASATTGDNGSGSDSLREPLLRRRRPEKPPAAPLVQQSLVDSQGRMVTFEGYAENTFGTLVSLLMPLTSFVFLGLFCLLCLDYYSGCEWSFPEQLCYIGNFPIFGTFETNSMLFLVFWTTSTAWFALLIWNRGGRMTNLFRFQVPLAEAQYVQVTVEEKREALSSGHSRILALQAWFTSKLVSLLHLRNLPGGLFSLSGSVSQTVPLEVPAKKDGPPFVQFRCVRYSLDVETGAFKQYEANTALSGGHQSFLDVLDAGGLPVGQQPLELPRSGDICPPVHKILLRSGPNEIPFEVDSWRAALLEEFSTFFFLYQFSIYAVCLWFSYWHYTIIACGIAILSGFLNVRVKLRNQASIKAMMQQTSTVTVRRGGKLQDIDSRDVVPGDILKVTGNKWVVPCDLLILKGAAVVDESTITGESMPVQRLAPTETITGVLPPQRFAVKHVLVAGTTVLQVADEDTWAVATHTGISTQKGQLLLLILYPPKLLFKYDEQLGAAFCLLLAYGCALVVFIMRMMYVRYASAQRIPLTASWGSSIFAVSCVLPTMLHIVLSVGQVVAAERLKGPEYNVFCVAPKRIALGGKVRVACFDKTGTLTTNSLEFFGVHQVRPSDVASAGPSDGGPFSGWVASAASGAASAFEESPCKAHWGPSVLCGLACTHSLSPFTGNETGVVGNAVEVNMFQASGWTLVTAGEVRSPVEGESIEILRRFDFSHTTMTMSAVVKHSPLGQRGVYCKGSFEQVSKKCLPSSLPPDFMARAQAHSYSGMYVLALAARPLAAGEDLTKLTRDDTERGLVMLGFLLFKNPLRSDTKDTIEKLRAGEVRSVMITGDAAGTAVCIAKEASLVSPGVPVLLGDIRGKESGGVVLWRCGEEDLTALNELQLSNEWLQWRRNYKQWRAGETKGARGEATSKQLRDASASDAILRRGSWPSFDAQLAAPSEQDTVSASSPDDYTFTTEELVLSRLFEWCELAVTQNAWEWLQERECSPDLRRVLLGSRMSTLKKGKALSSGKGSSTLAWELLTLIRIFARMTPGGKISVVEGLMSQGLICSMCGDGGNDSGALRTAHVGMALSNATSATVVAPFTTNRPSVAPIVDLLREGRGALATSFAGYKFCVHYGLLNSAFKTVTYYYGISLPMTSAYLQDLGGQLSLSWAMTLSKPSPSLIGDRPTSSLFSVYLLSSLLGMWGINCFFMFYGMQMVTHHEGYVPFPVHLVKITQWWKLNRNWESNALFFIYTFQLFWSAVVFSFGHFFRLAWYQNMTLLLLWGGGFGFLLLLLLGPASALTRAFHLVWELEWEHEPWTWQNPCPPVPGSLKRQLLVLSLVNGLVVSLWEKVIVQGGLGERVRARCRGLSKHITLRL